MIVSGIVEPEPQLYSFAEPELHCILVPDPEPDFDPDPT
jgi:hypothetical protein